MSQIMPMLLTIFVFVFMLVYFPVGVVQFFMGKRTWFQWMALVGSILFVLLMGAIAVDIALSAARSIQASNEGKGELNSSGAVPEEPLAAHDILNRFEGDWILHETQSIPSREEVTQRTRQVTARLTLDGHFVEMRTMQSNGALENIQYVTLDPVLGKFRHWYFGQNGESYEVLGEWDEDAEAIAWEGQLPNGLTVTNHERFTDDGKILYDAIVSGPDDVVLSRANGSLTSVK